MKARAALAALVLAGCTAFDRAPATADMGSASAEARSTTSAVSAHRSAAEDLVDYLARIRGMSESALAAEAARHRREASDAGRVKAALALSLSAQSEEGDIIALVEPVAKKDNGDRELRAVASFLQLNAGERRRLKESAAAAGSRLREERRLLEAQKQRADALQQKLDALTDLEKSLSDRPTQTR